MRRTVALGLALLVLLSGCTRAPEAEREDAVTPPPAEEAIPESTETLAEKKEAAPESTEIIPEQEETAMDQLTMRIGDTQVTVAWEENESVDALRRIVREGPLVIPMSMYGGFEQVGPIGQSLPRNDVQTSTGAGDIVLYAGDQLVVFYGSNAWAYTRLGHITDPDAEGLAELLGAGDAEITIALG